MRKPTRKVLADIRFPISDHPASAKDGLASGVDKTLRLRTGRPVLFSRGRRSTAFFTEDSQLYITPREYRLIRKGAFPGRSKFKFDSLTHRVVSNYRSWRPSRKDRLYRALLRHSSRIRREASAMPRSLFAGFSPVKLWNLSMVGSIVFGMMVMSLMYRYLGPNASAEQRMIAANSAYQSDRIVLSEVVGSGASLVLGSDNLNQDGDSDGRIDYISELLGDINPQSQEEMEKKEFQAKIEKMVSGYPIEKMVPYIVEKDRVVAAFLVSIAKKESDWGKRVPVLNGQDCNNYWGYRGIRRLMGSAGHTCFNSRKDAVDTVAKRIEQLVEKYGLNTPEKMIIWKCGSSCATHSDYSVRKWISDVETYFHELNGSQGDASLFDEEDV